MYSEPALLSRKQLGETGSARERERERERPGSGKTEPVESTERRGDCFSQRTREREREGEEREKPAAASYRRGKPVSPLFFRHSFLLCVRRTGGGSERSSDVVPGPARPSSPQEPACGALAVDTKDRTGREVLYAALAT